MLQALRKRSASILIKMLFGLLILSFAVWGIGDVVRGRAAKTTFAMVGDREITPEEVRDEFQREFERLQGYFQGRLDMETARNMGILPMTVNRIIDRTLFDLGAGELRLASSDDLVRDIIHNDPAFHNRFDKFDRDVFDQVLRSSGLSEGAFIEIVRGDLTRGQLRNTVLSGGTAPAGMTERIYRHREETRIAETVLITNTSVSDVGQPDQIALAAFHEKNAGRFTAPEYRKLTILGMHAVELAEEIAISEDRLRDIYEFNLAGLTQPERRHIQQFVVADEAAAKGAHEMLTQGRDFTEVGSEVAGMDADTMDLGIKERNQMLPELAEAAFSLPENGFSEPVESPLGWHVMKIVAIEPETRKAFEEVRDQLRDEIAYEEAIDSLFELANSLEDELGSGATLEEASGRLNLALLRISAVDAVGLDPQGNPVPGLIHGEQEVDAEASDNTGYGARPLPAGAILNLAFQTTEGTESELTEGGNDTYFLIRVDGVTPPAVKPLDSIRDEVAEALRTERRAEAAEKRARELIDRLAGGAQLASEAAGLGLKVATSEPFKRTGGAELPYSLVQLLFELNPGTAAMARGSEGTFVSVLKEIRNAEPGTDKEGLEALRQQLDQAIREDLVAQLSAALRQRYPVWINQRAFDEFY